MSGFANIKFRGKRPNGEWVVGAYVPAEYSQLGYASIVTKHHRFEVDPDTVEIYTGKKPTRFEKITSSPSALAFFARDVGCNVGYYKYNDYPPYDEALEMVDWLMQEAEW